MARLKYWVWLSALDGVRPFAKYELVRAFGGPDGVYNASEEELAAAVRLRKSEREHLTDHSLLSAERIIGECARLNIDILPLQDARYPERLRNIADPPVVLYVSGRLPEIDDELMIAVVGTRHPTHYGMKMAMKLGGELTEGGAIVVSGLASGCDSAAMEAALRAGGTTVGVLGTAIDRIYPAENRELFREVRFRGALVSEYGPGVRTYASSFTERNRIITGLSVGVVVTEAPEHSGTRNTVHHALDQNRDIFAVPGNVDAPVSAGCNDIIAEGAYPIRCGRDVLDQYSGVSRTVRRMPPLSEPMPEPTLRPAVTHIKKQGIDRKSAAAYSENENASNGMAEKVSALSPIQQKILGAMTRPDMYADEITEAAGTTAAQTLAQLTMLQIMGFVRQGDGKRYTRSY